MDLVVGDRFVDSTPDTVTIAVVTTADFAGQQTVDAINAVGSLPPSSVTTNGNRTAFGNFLMQVIAALQVGDVVDAKKKLPGRHRANRRLHPTRLAQSPRRKDESNRITSRHARTKRLCICCLRMRSIRSLGDFEDLKTNSQSTTTFALTAKLDTQQRLAADGDRCNPEPPQRQKPRVRRQRSESILFPRPFRGRADLGAMCGSSARAGSTHAGEAVWFCGVLRSAGLVIVRVR